LAELSLPTVLKEAEVKYKVEKSRLLYPGAFNPSAQLKSLTSYSKLMSVKWYPTGGLKPAQ